MDYGRFKPFGTLLGGVAAHSPQNTQHNNKVSFGVSLGGGVKIYLTDFLGIRLQGRLMMPLYVSGVGLGCGIGTGGAGCGGGETLTDVKNDTAPVVPTATVTFDPAAGILFASALLGAGALGPVPSRAS